MSSEKLGTGLGLSHIARKEWSPYWIPDQLNSNPVVKKSMDP
jgi:hypothetical protein